MSKTKRNNLDRKLAIDQLAELLKAGQQIKLTASKGSQKGHSDLPLFLRPQDQQKLF